MTNKYKNMPSFFSPPIKKLLFPKRKGLLHKQIRSLFRKPYSSNIQCHTFPTHKARYPTQSRFWQSSTKLSFILFTFFNLLHLPPISYPISSSSYQMRTKNNKALIQHFLQTVPLYFMFHISYLYQYLLCKHPHFSLFLKNETTRSALRK